MLTTLKRIKQSPVHHRLATMGAVMTEASGWLVVEHFGDATQEAKAACSSVGISDQSSSPKWELQGANVTQSLGKFLHGAAPAVGHVSYFEDGFVCRSTVALGLLVREDGKLDLPASLNSHGLDKDCSHVIERTSGLGCFSLVGPKARSVLCKLIPLDLRDAAFPDLRCAWGPLATVRVMLVRRNRWGMPGYDVFFSREYGEYLWDSILDAGKEIQLRPIGRAAIRLLERP